MMEQPTRSKLYGYGAILALIALWCIGLASIYGVAADVAQGREAIVVSYSSVTLLLLILLVPLGLYIRRRQAASDQEISVRQVVAPLIALLIFAGVFRYSLAHDLFAVVMALSDYVYCDKFLESTITYHTWCKR